MGGAQRRSPRQKRERHKAVNNDPLSKEQLLALSALAAAITAESVTWSALRETEASYTAAGDAHDNGPDDGELQKTLSARATIAQATAHLASDAHDLAVDVRKRLELTCKRLGAL